MFASLWLYHLLANYAVCDSTMLTPTIGNNLDLALTQPSLPSPTYPPPPSEQPTTSVRLDKCAVVVVGKNRGRTEVNEEHEGKRKNEALWPVFQITWQRSRYVYDMHYVYKAISKDVLEYCIRNVSESALPSTMPLLLCLACLPRLFACLFACLQCMSGSRLLDDLKPRTIVCLLQD